MKGLMDYSQLEFSKRSTITGSMQRMDMDLNSLHFIQSKLYRDEGQMPDDEFIEVLKVFKSVIDNYLNQTKEIGEIV